MPTPESPAASVLGHAPETVIFDGETWKIMCSCSWECWNIEDEWVAWDEFEDHLVGNVRAHVHDLHKRTKAVDLSA